MWSKTILCLKANHFFPPEERLSHTAGSVFCVRVQQDTLRFISVLSWFFSLSSLKPLCLVDLPTKMHDIMTSYVGLGI